MDVALVAALADPIASILCIVTTSNASRNTISAAVDGVDLDIPQTSALQYRQNCLA